MLFSTPTSEAAKTENRGHASSENVSMNPYQENDSVYNNYGYNLTNEPSFNFAGGGRGYRRRKVPFEG